MPRIRYLYRYVLHVGRCPDTHELLTLDAMVALYELETALAEGRVLAYNMDLPHAPGTVHLFPTRQGCYLAVRNNIEREFSTTRLIKRLAREGLVKIEAT